MTAKAVIICALDTKGAEGKYIKELIEAAGVRTITLNTAVLGEPHFEPDVTAGELAGLAGVPLAELIARGDRGFAVETMMNGAVKKVTELHARGEVGGVIGLGGSAGTTIGTAVMRALPVGVPKVMVSTIASGNVRPYVGMSDIHMVNTIVDIAGLNSLSRRTLGNAAHALAGMVKGGLQAGEAEKPIVAMSMFGVTTPCANVCREELERRGYEVLCFHATGIGGQAMESLIESGLAVGVLDMTTTELADDAAGGLLSAGPHRLEAAGKRGIPQVVSVGAADMANFGALDTVPEPFRSRRLYKHNPNVTLMRTSASENGAVGGMIADKLNRGRGQTAVFLPLRGVSELDAPGKPFHGPEEDEALFEALRRGLDPKIRLVELDCHINEERFALAMAEKLANMIETETKDNREE
ncbi:Tm-1-like ATP-binding domain-containing protein [Paenibacillus arenilitoris]|uniref:Tm-1-like ATP-binding domain-containing protein n=1 Tax=Paenibacillus arenilitoris TaxID=2772299 RepID=A0A927CTA3_9BACL|nr:Tm-1-like ATP-binding domain-containing protein [Paenibacillus arenilitoris]MBD2872827.1 Tm-1-like ATP-binding domain-containing protein [Paenibacillus arenilitoris]